MAENGAVHQYMLSLLVTAQYGETQQTLHPHAFNIHGCNQPCLKMCGQNRES